MNFRQIRPPLKFKLGHLTSSGGHGTGRAGVNRDHFGFQKGPLGVKRDQYPPFTVAVLVFMLFARAGRPDEGLFAAFLALGFAAAALGFAAVVAG
jgi:hypothetical protein